MKEFENTMSFMLSMAKDVVKKHLETLDRDAVMKQACMILYRCQGVVEDRQVKRLIEEFFENLDRTGEQPAPAKPLMLADIERAACEYYELNYESIFERNNRAKIVNTRYAIFYFALRYLNISKIELARRYHKDHATIDHGLKKVNDMIDTDPKYRDELFRLEEKIEFARYGN